MRPFAWILLVAAGLALGAIESYALHEIFESRAAGGWTEDAPQIVPCRVLTL